jgi:hypothetical protein
LGKTDALDTERIENLLRLAPSVYGYWDHTICSFRPISVNEKNTSIDLALYWLPLRGKSITRRDKLPLDEHLYPDQPIGFTDSPGEDLFIFHKH